MNYIPEFKGSGYDGVKLKDVLQMSTWVSFNEDYASFFSDINSMGRSLALRTSRCSSSWPHSSARVRPEQSTTTCAWIRRCSGVLCVRRSETL
jgi:hypothetical protein